MDRRSFIASAGVAALVAGFHPWAASAATEASAGPDDARLNELCFEAYNIQSHGLRQRLASTRVDKIVIGVSGGLDSTHALIVAAKACDRLGLPRTHILGFTMPGFAKFRVVKKPATKAREGINPFTKAPMTFPAKPASKSVRARPIKAIKDAIA